MYFVKSNDEMASDFITGTCDVFANWYSPSPGSMLDSVLSDDCLQKLYLAVCGSRAEFYIRPINTCIEDVDTLLFIDSDLAFEGAFPVLPSDISFMGDTIHCFEIKPYPGFLGFVRIRALGEMKFNWKRKEYKLNRSINPDTYIKMDKIKMLNFYVDQMDGPLDKRSLSRRSEQH